MSKISGAQLVLRCLKAHGIQKLFTIVGDTILPLCDATIDEGMDLVDTRHEAAALHMADGWCRVTGQPAAALVTGGPGFANAISALPNIFTSESPVILLAGCGPLAELGMYSLQEIVEGCVDHAIKMHGWKGFERELYQKMLAHVRTVKE